MSENLTIASDAFRKVTTPVIIQPAIAWNKIKKNHYNVTIDKNPTCQAEVEISKYNSINDTPFISQEDLIVISIPLNKNHLVSSFYDEKLKKTQINNLYVYNIKYPTNDDKIICLPLKDIPNADGYSTEPIFPESVTRAIVGMLIGK